MTERVQPGVQERTRTVDTSPRRELAFDLEVMRFVCGMGTNEISALAVALIANIDQSEKPKLKDVRAEFSRAQGTRVIRPGTTCIKHDTPRARSSLLASGIVEFEEDEEKKDSEKSLSLSDEYREKALAFAGHILKFSLTHKPSLFDYFGTLSGAFVPGQIGVINKNIPPSTRTTFYEALIKSDLPLSTSILVSAANRNEGNVSVHLSTLARSGIIEYESRGLSGSQFIYKLLSKNDNGETLSPESEHPRYPSLSRAVYRITYENMVRDESAWLDAGRTTTILRAIDPNYTNRNEKFLTDTIRLVYSHFTKLGLVEKIGYEGARKSEVNLTPTQKRALLRLVGILRRLQKPDSKFFRDGKREALRIANDPDAVRKLIEKACRKTPPKTRISEVKRTPSAPKVRETMVFSRGEEWRRDSACLDEDADIFFPEPESGRNSKIKLEAKEEIARKYCRKCPVRDACLGYALESNQEVGIWGGLNERERELIIDARAVGLDEATHVVIEPDKK